MAQVLESDAEPELTPETAANHSSCPACDSDILNVHGIHTCAGCRWFDAASQ